MVNLCYSDCTIPYEAYKHLIKEVKGKEVIMEIKDFNETIDLIFKLKSNDKQIKLKKIKYNKQELKNFIEVRGGGKKIILVIGYPPANEKKIILEKGMQPVVVTWNYEIASR